MILNLILLLVVCLGSAESFTPIHGCRRLHQNNACLFQSAESSPPPLVAIDPKEAVKIFGRLAEKYIMLDSSGGDCCYSACSDCEYRLPGGGYIMADQSAARPKWIPSYESRAANGKEHTPKWSSELFADGPAIEKEAFCSKVAELEFAPPLGGPYVSKSAASIDDSSAAEYLFDLLAEGKEKLTRYKMGLRIKELGEGEEGMTWPKFQTAMNC